MHPVQQQQIDIESTTRLAIVMDTQSNRMDLDFMLNGHEGIEEVKTEEAKEKLRPLLTIRPRLVRTSTENELQPLHTVDCKYDTETEVTSPGSSWSELSPSEYSSRRPSADLTLPPMRLERPISEETSTSSFTSLPPIQCPEWPTFFGQPPPRPSEASLPRLLCDNNNHRSHSCGNCWSLDEFGTRNWDCCQCRNQRHRNSELDQYPYQLDGAYSKHRLSVSRSETHRGSRSPLRHDPYGRRASYPVIQSLASRTLPPHKARRKSSSTKITKAPHSNKKYPREHVFWIRYMKEDCATKFETMATDLWERKWPGTRPDISHQSVSSRYYRDNLAPLLDANAQLINIDGKVVMRSVKVRERTTKHKGIPYTFVDKLPHQALMYDWVLPEHKEQARAIIAEDEKNPHTKAAICRRALLEFENTLNPPTSATAGSARPANRGRHADAAGYVILVENKACEAACRCAKKKNKDAEQGPQQELLHASHCPSAAHPALRMCDCAEVVRSRVALHLPSCASLKFGREFDV